MNDFIKEIGSIAWLLDYWWTPRKIFEKFIFHENKDYGEEFWFNQDFEVEDNVKVPG